MSCPYPGCDDPPGPDHVHDLGVFWNARYFCPPDSDGPVWSCQREEPPRHDFGPKGTCQRCGYRIPVKLRERISRAVWRTWFAIGGR
jgi:DNA-directed RNA polymerase subunit RPC12/RpoP